MSKRELSRSRTYKTSFHICKACFENTLQEEYESRFPTEMPECIVVEEGEACPQCGATQQIYNRDILWVPILQRVYEPSKRVVGGLHARPKSKLRPRAWRLTIQGFDYLHIERMPLLSVGRSWWGKDSAFVSGWRGWAKGDRQFMEFCPTTRSWMHYPATLQSWDYANMRTWEVAINSGYVPNNQAAQEEERYIQRLVEHNKKQQELRDKKRE